jgi:hypothetical protein
MIKDYYAVLGIDRDATDEQIKTVYRTAIKECHPDIVGDNPQLAERFQELTEAYKVLADPYRRKLHDQNLPLKSYPLRNPTVQRIWKEVTDVIVMRSDRVGPFERALQEAVPLVLEGNLVVVGYSDKKYREGAHLKVAANERALLEALELVTGGPLEFRYIQGDTLQDWEQIKSNEARAAKARSTAQAAEAQLGAGWDDLVTRMHRTYNELGRRQYPQVRAVFVSQTIGWILEAEAAARVAGSSEEILERAVAKAIDRLASLVETPSTLIAMEYVRRKSAER